MKLITRLRGTISVIRVNHEDEALSVLEVVPANNPVMEDWSELGVSVQAPAMGQDFWCNTARVTQEQYEGLVYDKVPLEPLPLRTLAVRSLEVQCTAGARRTARAAGFCPALPRPTR